MKKVLFIDRDGTILEEPKTDYQVDTLEKFAFLPKSITNLARIFHELDYEFVMVTNQDGLGTDSYPEETFWPYQNKMLEILETEGVKFDDILIDRSFEHEGLETRKPGIGMMKRYLETGAYDLSNSFVIGDRLTDVKLALNLGAKAIFIGETAAEGAALSTTDWDAIYTFLKQQRPTRTARVHRSTSETDIKVELNLDGSGKMDIKTGLGFFDHMLEQVAKHARIDLHIQVKGDLHIDEHHTIEDTALALGEAFVTALGDKRGISRYGFFLLPMDDVLAQVAIDFSGRPWAVWQAEFNREKVGDMPTEMFYHFFKSFSDTAKANVNIKVDGQNEHHKIEAIYKAFARAIRMAVERDLQDNTIPSTKGIL
ncbi:bifunctional histidinol-phosphatase/imidazoleglycerol-phosphate dehydratase HisB [Pontibacter akesuensis]|uniref:Histidine biosynthesis bifunctional protein HisB n=1 Tax=Pontibacter akesuensis TaxID=388950 RepID=A0A1I7G7V0_9BACT|nr:bifunctional histidinol-phosphatase/imidazoleglycerol-phosphate dehydratase HisB [Pontibacter akesuensis]GHA58275.1 histidine biosynthesis bifunctional protein HisB [Pontibacter akesuensis]SFU44535.1 imidazoleglycerol-phosphate dehydratase [Pontibacter akesuensis]